MLKLSLTAFLYKLAKNKNTVPRWIIFSVDLGICVTALFAAFLLRFNFDFKAMYDYGFLPQIVLATIINAISFKIFRTYAGIIRLSSTQEGLRCVAAVFVSSLILLISTIVCEIFQLANFVPYSVLIIYFFTASFLVVAYRIWIRSLYNKVRATKLLTENVMIFGETMNGGTLKSAIESVSGRQFNVVGFVENNKSLVGKHIANSAIYSWEQAREITHKKNVKLLFLASDNIDIKLKNEIVDFCLANNILVKLIPAVQDWADGHLHNKQLRDLKIEDLLNRPSIKLASEHVQKYLSGKRVMITGAAGSIGSEIVRQLAGIDVKQLILCDNRETALYELEYQLHHIANENDKLIVSISDVRSYDIMQNLFETYQPQIVFHAAAYKHVPLMELQPCEAVKNNIMGTKIVADLAVAYGAERFVLISTDKAVNPTNVMGASKRIAEMYVQELQLSLRQRRQNIISDAEFAKPMTKFITTRFGNVLGSSGSVIPRFQTQIDKGGPVTVTHPDVMRYFMTIPEACSLVLEAGTMGKGGEIFVFDMGEPVKIADLANKMIKLQGLIPDKDIRVEFTGLRPGEKLFEELLCKDEEVIPTHHSKIMISKVSKIKQNPIGRDVDHLIDLAESNNDISVVSQMKNIVPEYKSENSTFEKLDYADKQKFVAVSNSTEPDFRNWGLNKSLQ